MSYDIDMVTLSFLTRILLKSAFSFGGRLLFLSVAEAVDILRDLCHCDLELTEIKKIKIQ